MSEEFGDDDSRRLAVEAKVFKRLDKRREEKSAIQAINKVKQQQGLTKKFINSYNTDQCRIRNCRYCPN